MQNYKLAQILLHDFVLSNKFINKSLFEIEKIFFLTKNNIVNQTHIFITGLPRSGTTSLLNYIYSSDYFASLTFKNMPFILAPNFSNFFNKKDIPKKERLHKDGIFYDINSPEALDEIFFNNDKEFVVNELLNYINLILASKKKTRYLSKNNLNYKRIDLINSILPNAIFLIPIRKPLNHANSLLNQHLIFSQLHRKDDFIKRYMNYVGHNEFGLCHKSWFEPKQFEALNDINYWLEQWYFFYLNILNKYKNYNNCLFILYEELTNQTYLSKLLKKIKLDKFEKLKFFSNSNKDLDYTRFSNKILKDANKLYDEFKSSV